MPAHRSDDPLVLIPLRVPASVRDQLLAEAESVGGTLSDALRSHLMLDAVTPLGKPSPRRRTTALAPVSSADPALMRQLSSIGNNLNQLARFVHSKKETNSALSNMRLIAALYAIEKQLSAIGSSNAA